MQSKLNAAVDNTHLVVELVKFCYQIENLSVFCKCLSGTSQADDVSFAACVSKF